MSADERAMVRAMAAGDEAGLVALYDQLAPQLLAVLDRMLGSRSEAERRLQEVFVDLWQRADQYRDDRGSVRTWAVTVARRHAAGRAAPAADQRPGKLRVGAALGELSAEQREVLELAYFAGLSHGEIADRLGIPPGTATSRIIAGMKQLRARLKGQAEHG